MGPRTNSNVILIAPVNQIVAAFMTWGSVIGDFISVETVRLEDSSCCFIEFNRKVLMGIGKLPPGETWDRKQFRAHRSADSKRGGAALR